MNVKDRVELVPANIRDWVNDAKHEVDVALSRAEEAEREVARLLRMNARLEGSLRVIAVQLGWQEKDWLEFATLIAAREHPSEKASVS